MCGKLDFVRRAYIGPYQREILELGCHEHGVPLVGFAQRQWRGWKSLWRRGLIDVRYSCAYTTDEGRKELERLRRLDEAEAAVRQLRSERQVGTGMYGSSS